MEHISRYPSLSTLFAGGLILAATVFLGALVFQPTAAHAVAPNGFTSVEYRDSNADAAIDQIVVVVNGGEALTACVVTSGELTSDWSYTGGSFGGSIASATCNTGTATITFTLTGTTANLTGGGTAPTISYNNGDTDNSIANASGNLGGAGPTSATDDAGPVLISSSPYSLQQRVNRWSTITLTFSETISSFGDTVSPSTINTTNSHATGVTTVRSLGPWPSGQITYTIGTASDAAANTFAGVKTGASGLANPLVFSVASQDSDSVAAEETSGSVSILSPEADDSLDADSAVEISWSSDAEGASYATLSYSEDGGSTWEIIASNTLNDGSYMWTVPHLQSDEVMVKIALTDLAEELASDTSGAFTVWYYDEDNSDDWEDEDGNPDAYPEREIDGIVSGDFIKVAGSTTIYYVDEDMSRRPFFDAQTYFTYEDDFDAVTEVSSNTLAKFSIGAPMMPKPGVVLVKIQSVAKVYMVEEAADGSYELRWITSEEVAEDMFGSQWSSYVLDVDATLFTRYEMGDDVTDADDESVDRDMMKMRMHLHE
jgi:hypothetical protein